VHVYVYGGFKRGTDLADVAPEGEAAVAGKGPDETGSGGQGCDGAAYGHDEDDDDHSGRAGFGAGGLVEDLHVGEA